MNIRRPRGEGHGGCLILLGSVVLVAALAVLLLLRAPSAAPPPGSSGARALSSGPLKMYCAAGVRVPVSEAVKRYREECGVEVQLEFGGSNTLLSQIKVHPAGDLYLAAEQSYAELARQQGLIEEILPVAYMRPRFAVRKGNPKGLHALKDLLREDVRLALVNPEAGALGKALRRMLEPSGVWTALDQAVHSRGVYKPNVQDVANDLKLGSVDAASVWDTTVRLMPELEALEIPELADAREQTTLGVLKCTRDPAAALRFARYLTARDRGLPIFAANGFPETIAGDAWEPTPEITIFSGGVNRLAIQETLQEFARREGAEINTIYNGCGILLAQMRGLKKGEQRGRFPDAYFACDTSFMAQAREWFTDEVEMTETRMVILTPKGNPRQIRGLADLARPGLKVGLAHPDESALGHLTRELLREAGLYDGVQKNLATNTPTADLLVNSMKVGALDAAVVYEVNAAPVRGALEIVPLEHPKARAVQPYAVARDSSHPQLVRRLLQRLRGPESRKRYEAAGFQMRAAEGP